MSVKGYLEKWKAEHPNGMFSEPVRTSDESDFEEVSRERRVLSDFFGSRGFKAFIVIFTVILASLIILVNLKITKVNIEGNDHTSREEIMKAFFPDETYWNPFLFRFREATEDPKEFLFVDKYQIEYRGLTEIDIIIYEKQIVGYVGTEEGYMFFDQDGVVVEITDDPSGEDVPMVNGLDTEGIDLYKKIPAEERVLREILQVSQFLKNKEIQWGGVNAPLYACVDSIDVDEHGNITCELGNVSVFLGGQNDMEAKLMEMADILPELYGREGTLYLNTYNEHAEDPAYVFK